MNCEASQEIRLTGKHAVGKFAIALVDPADYAAVAAHRWRCSPPLSGGKRYAKTNVRVAGKQVTLYMHRVVTSAPSGLDVDHINHNSLDNRRANLRVVDRSTNLRNRKPVEVSGICKACSTHFHLANVPAGTERHRLYCSDSCRRWPAKRGEREATARWSAEQGLAG